VHIWPGFASVLWPRHGTSWWFVNPSRPAAQALLARLDSKLYLDNELKNLPCLCLCQQKPSPTLMTWTNCCMHCKLWRPQHWSAVAAADLSPTVAGSGLVEPVSGSSHCPDLVAAHPAWVGLGQRDKVLRVPLSVGVGWVLLSLSSTSQRNMLSFLSWPAVGQHQPG